MELTEKRSLAVSWFKNLRDSICSEFEKIEKEFDSRANSKFSYKKWNRNGGGGGEMGIMYGKVLKK